MKLVCVLLQAAKPEDVGTTKKSASQGYVKRGITCPADNKIRSQLDDADALLDKV